MTGIAEFLSKPGVGLAVSVAVIALAVLNTAAGNRIVAADVIGVVPVVL